MPGPAEGRRAEGGAGQTRRASRPVTGREHDVTFWPALARICSFVEPRTLIRGLISRFIPHASFFVSDYRFVLACLSSTSLCFISCLLAEPNRAPPALPRSPAQGSSHENSTEAHTTWPDATHRLVYYNLHIELKPDRFCPL